MSVDVDWTHLPPDLIETIAKKLTIYIDYLRFRAVCHSWRSSVPKTPHHLPPQLPWLMLPRSLSHRHRQPFFDLSLNKIHFLDLPPLSQTTRRCGSSHGWLAIVDESPPLFLINPLTGSKIHLPPLSSFPNVLDFDFSRVGREYSLQTSSGVIYTRSLTEMRDSFIRKVVLSSSPSNGGDFIALAILNQTGDLAFCRKGEESWSFIDGAQSYSEDVIYFDGLFYAVNEFGVVAVCDVNGPSPKVSLCGGVSRVSRRGDIQYLVSSSEGLLLATRYIHMDLGFEPDLIYKTRGFGVFRLSPSGSCWERVENLGDRAMFLGKNSSLCLKASDYPGCKANCVYFTDEYSDSNYDGVWGDHDLGIFNLGDGSVEPFPCYPSNSHSRLHWPPPLWLTPDPC